MSCLCFTLDWHSVAASSEHLLLAMFSAQYEENILIQG